MSAMLLQVTELWASASWDSFTSPNRWIDQAAIRNISQAWIKTFVGETRRSGFWASPCWIFITAPIIALYISLAILPLFVDKVLMMAVVRWGVRCWHHCK